VLRGAREIRPSRSVAVIWQKVRAAALQTIKQCVGRRPVTLHIWDGPLKGYRWRFDASSNNEVILGFWEHNMQSLYARYLRPGDVVFDLGAHQGFLAMLAAGLVGDHGEVHAFEASATNFSRMVDNLRLNGVRNCRPVHAAVSDREGSVEFSDTAHDNSNTYIRSSPHFRDKPTVQVPALSLDTYLDATTSRPPDFIKVDVEGAEFEALVGAERLLNTRHPLMYLETHNLHNPGVDRLCLEFLANAGYRIVETIDQTSDASAASYILSTQ
jgi:FkbM family methyltransferase